MYDLPWYFSTAVLHDTMSLKLVPEKINKLTQNFNARCLNFDFVHINELVTLILDFLLSSFKLFLVCSC